jgi:hypothetical protein
MSFLEHIGLATISGIIVGIVLGLGYIVYDEITRTIRVKREDKNFVRMQTPNGSEWSVNKEFMEEFLKDGWTIVE